MHAISTPGLRAVHLVQRAQLWSSIYQWKDARTRKTVVWREKTRLASPEVGLRWLQRFDDAIQAEPPFLLLTRSRRQKEALLAGCKWCEKGSFNFPCKNVFQEWHLQEPCTFYVKTRLFLCGETWVQSNLHVRPSSVSDQDHNCSKHQKFHSNSPIVRTSRKRLRPLFGQKVLWFFSLFLL